MTMVPPRETRLGWVCPKCFRTIEPRYYSLHVAACQGPDPLVALEGTVVSGIARGDLQASTPEGIAPQASKISGLLQLNMPADPATIPEACE